MQINDRLILLIVYIMGTLMLAGSFCYFAFNYGMHSFTFGKMHKDICIIDHIVYNSTYQSFFVEWIIERYNEKKRVLQTYDKFIIDSDPRRFCWITDCHWKKSITCTLSYKDFDPYSVEIIKPENANGFKILTICFGVNSLILLSFPLSQLLLHFLT
jgi:hypothetical protein